jgi:Carboxypeptidase regulatory-like domain/TonB dependent receptor
MRKPHHFLFSLRALFFSAGLLLHPAAAQVTTADILGTATDASGAVLPGVKITAENLATQAVHSTVSDANGNFVVPLLPVGRYNVKAEAKGFKASNIREVTLAEGDKLRVDMRLEVGQIEQSVEVVAQTAALQSDSSVLGTLVNERAVQDLPLNGRNFMRLAQLGAGANESAAQGLPSGNRPDDRRQSSSVSVNGQRDYSNNFLIDGLDNNERYVGTIVVKPAMDALVEFKVLTSSYSAEVGRTAGGVINLVTKSGTDNLHGSLYEFFRNEHLDARNFFAGPGPTPSYKQNQFGGSMGGPIRKNKTFFFGDYEGLRLRQGITYTSTVPTALMRQGNFAGANPIFDPTTTRPNPAVSGGFIRDPFPNNRIPISAMDPPGLKLMQLYPVPTNAGLVNNFTYSPNRKQREDKFDARVDHQFSERDSFFARYSFNDTSSFLPPQLPASGAIQAGSDTGFFAGPALERAQNVQLNFVHTFRPNLLMEQKAGYSRFGNHSLPPNYGNNIDQQIGIPGANIDSDSSGLSPVGVSGFRGLGDATSTPLIDINNIFQYATSVTYNHSSHTIKFGAAVVRRQMTQFQSNQAKGQFSFDANFTNDPSGAVARSGNAAASLLLGWPASTVRAKYLVWPGYRTTEFGGFVQDDWRVTRTLTLNLGLRYEIFTPISEVHNQAANADLAAGKILVSGRNGVSGSAGVPTDWNSFAPRVGFAATLTPRTVLRGGFGISFFPPVAGNNTGLRNPPFISLFSVANTPITTTNRLSDGLPLPVATDPLNPAGTLTIVGIHNRLPYVEQFNLTLQRELISGLVWNLSYVGNLSRKMMLIADRDLAVPGPGAIQPRRPYATVFPGVTSINEASTAGTADYHSLQTSVEHRFRNGLNLLSNYTYAHLIDDNPIRGGGKPGSGPFPQLVTNLRLERGNSDIDLRHRFVFIADYALPFAKSLSGVGGLLAKGWQVNAIATIQSGVTFTVQNGSPRANTGGGDRPNLVGDPNSGPHTVTQWFNTAAFAPQPANQIGNVGRNTMFGPPLRNLDFSLLKDFAPVERIKLQFRAEIFNILNHPNFGVPGNSLGNATFGVISDTANALPRNIQFALKLIF